MEQTCLFPGGRGAYRRVTCDEFLFSSPLALYMAQSRYGGYDNNVTYRGVTFIAHYTAACPPSPLYMPPFYSVHPVVGGRRLP